MFKWPVKCWWRFCRDFRSLLLWFYFASLPGSYFRKLGWGTKFFGRVRFGSVEGNISIGRNCYVGHDVMFSCSRGASIEMQDGGSFNTGCHVVAIYGISIGPNSTFGEYCSIRDQNHKFDSVETPVNQQGYFGAPIKIGRDVRIGRGVYIGPGVEIGDCAVVGPNSVVAKSIPPLAIAVGSPARVVGMRGDSNNSKQNAFAATARA
jgi:acetyltransferase-like isoleucine patch superfamily enzyme